MNRSKAVWDFLNRKVLWPDRMVVGFLTFLKKGIQAAWKAIRWMITESNRSIWILLAVLSLLAIVSLIVWWPQLSAFLRQTGNNISSDELTNHEIIRNLFLALAAIVGVILAWWRSSSLYKQATIAEQGLLTDRYIKATEQLGSDKESVRIGAIYSLWRIAADSKERNDKLAVLDVLCAFVRASGNGCPTHPSSTRDPQTSSNDDTAVSQQQPEQRVREDIQIVMNLLGKRMKELNLKTDENNPYRFDLTSAMLAHANLEGFTLSCAILNNANLTDALLTQTHFDSAHLKGAILKEANLEGAYLMKADLTEANLMDADLTGAKLTGAKLMKADLTWAKLMGAKLMGAKLMGAYLMLANLKGAYLEGAEFMEAELNGANLQDVIGLTSKQLAHISVLKEPIWNLPADLTIPPDKIGYKLEENESTEPPAGDELG